MEARSQYSSPKPSCGFLLKAKPQILPGPCEAPPHSLSPSPGLAPSPPAPGLPAAPQHIRHLPAPGPLHWPVALPGAHFPLLIPVAPLASPFRFLCKGDFLGEAGHAHSLLNRMPPHTHTNFFYHLSLIYFSLSKSKTKQKKVYISASCIFSLSPARRFSFT